MIFSYRCPKRDKLRLAIFNNHVINEANYIPQLIKYIDLKNSDHESIKNAAIDLVTKVRKLPHVGMLDAFLKEYDLSTEEGVTIMCIAESILRIPDAKTGNALIQDKLTSANWDKHIGHSRSLFVNASTWAFLFTGQILHARNSENTELQNTLSKILSDSSKPVIRQAILQAIKSISNHFIIGNEIQGGFKKSRERNNRIYRYSFDMLGEAAITSEDADKYFEKYLFAIRYLNNYGNNDPIMGKWGSDQEWLMPVYSSADTDKLETFLRDSEVNKFARTTGNINDDAWHNNVCRADGSNAVINIDDQSEEVTGNTYTTIDDQNQVL